MLILFEDLCLLCITDVDVSSELFHVTRCTGGTTVLLAQYLATLPAGHNMTCPDSLVVRNEDRMPWIDHVIVKEALDFMYHTQKCAMQDMVH